MTAFSRRNFLKTSFIGGVAATFINPLETFASFGQNPQYTAHVSLTTGDSRADMVFRALKPFSDQIATAIGSRRVVLKPNNVSIKDQLASTHAETLEAILEFLKSIRKDTNVTIAESAAGGPTFDGYSNFGYYGLAKKYGVKMVDLDLEPFKILYVFDEKDFRPHPVRMASLLLDPGSFVISATPMKTHDRIVATLSLKNVVVGAPIKDKGFTWSHSNDPKIVNDKPVVHGGGIRGINYNLFALSDHLHPHLSVIDGFKGMQGNGPVGGYPVDHRVCVASTDWLAADRVAVELMGIDFAKVGYLNYCANAGKGVADLNKIEIIGESISRHIKPYKLSDNISEQLVWMNPA
jgi:uncharacterized protein (DUF362 family)